MKDISLEELLEAGCHFGHQVTRQNPKARDFVFETRDGINIIDLAKTKEYLDEALLFVKEVGSRPHASLLIVGTKRQAQEIIAAQLKRANEAVESTIRVVKENNSEDHQPVTEKVAANVYSVTNRWIGGTLTNFTAVQKNFQRLHELTQLLGNEDAREKYTKRELGLFEKERAKLEIFYSGIDSMRSLPTLLYVIDTHTEDLAVREARRMEIPVVGIVDTNADPDVVSNPIPANDDAVGSIQLLTTAVIDAWIEGKTTKEVKLVKKETKISKETEDTKVTPKETEPKKKVTKKTKKTV